MITMKTSKPSARKLPPVTKYDTATYAIGAHDTAWAFMRACDAAGLMAGFPSLDGRYTVKVSIRSWMDREAADKLAGGNKVVAYAFAGSVAA